MISFLSGSVEEAVLLTVTVLTVTVLIISSLTTGGTCSIIFSASVMKAYLFTATVSAVSSRTGGTRLSCFSVSVREAF